MKNKWLNLIDIPAPCDKSWNGMIGDDKTRLCLHCDKNIHNLEEMSDKEIEKLIFQSKDRVCVRLTRDENGHINTKNNRRAKIAAGFLSITLALTTVANSQTIDPNKETETKSSSSKNQHLVTLTIADLYENRIIKAEIKIINLETKIEVNGLLNNKGEFQFAVDKFGDYEIIISKMIDYSDSKKIVSLTAENSRIVLQTNESAIIGTTYSSAGNKINASDIKSLPPKSTKLISKSNQNLKNTSRISFTILDENEAVIPDAQVKLVNDKTKQVFIVKTDKKGVAYFSNLPKGRYEVEAKMTGFRTERMFVVLKDSDEPNIKMTLEVGLFIGMASINGYETPIFNSILRGDFDVIRKFISSGKDINIIDEASGQTLLHLATELGNFELVKMLLNAGIKVNMKDKIGRTPIHLIDVEDESVQVDTQKILQVLIEKGADVNTQSKFAKWKTVLIKAVYYENVEIVKILLKAGANPNLKDADGETAMMKTNSEEIKQLLKKYGAKN